MNFMKHTALLLMLLISITVFSKTKDSTIYTNKEELSQQEKTSDFLYLYNILKDNYPYFGITQRKYHMDWLGKKDQYLEKIANTKTDSSFIVTLKSIIKDLKDDHLDLMPTEEFGFYKNGYEQIIKSNPHYLDIYPEISLTLEVLNNPNVRADYWRKFIINKSSFVSDVENNYETPKPLFPNFWIDPDGIAIMRFMSFYNDAMEDIELQIDSFLNKISDTKDIIIDIQNNGGGSDDSWKKNIVSRLIDKPIVFPRYIVVKDGKINRKFYPATFEKGEKFRKTNLLPNIPKEFTKDKYYINLEIDTIYPYKSISYKKNIYLLINKGVYSSAESFALFCKTTKCATVVGETSAGDGGGKDPVIFMLPKSGILVRAVFDAPLNNDGSLNAEFCTTPDIQIDAKDADSRLIKMIEYIKQKK